MLEEKTIWCGTRKEIEEKFLESLQETRTLTSGANGTLESRIGELSITSQLNEIETYDKPVGMVFFMTCETTPNQDVQLSITKTLKGQFVFLKEQLKETYASKRKTFITLSPTRNKL
jgi:hypothetical protein